MCAANGKCESKAKQTVGAFLCAGPHSKVCKNSESCCQSKDNSGEFTCCPSTHMCGVNGKCEPKAKETVGAFLCAGPHSKVCKNSESCCQSKDKSEDQDHCPTR